MFGRSRSPTITKDGTGVACSSFHEGSSWESELIIDFAFVLRVAGASMEEGHATLSRSSCNDNASPLESEQIKDLACASSALRVSMTSCASLSSAAQLEVPVKDSLCRLT